jgi:hypothetical protein
LQSQINYYHKSNPGTEWSGVLFYKIIEGSIVNPADLVLYAESFYLMNIGTASYTSFDYSEDILNVYDEYPELEEYNTGLIHTHHGMDSYFSSTDMEELEDNASLYNFYLSLIVNNKGNYAAKLAVPVVENQVTQKIKNEEGQLVDFQMDTSSIIYTIDLDVSVHVDEFDIQRQKDIKAKSVKETDKKYEYKWPAVNHNWYNQTNNYKVNNQVVKKEKSLEVKVQDYLVSSFRIYSTQVSLDQIASSYRTLTNKSITKLKKDEVEDRILDNLQFGLDQHFDEKDFTNEYAIWLECEKQIKELSPKYKLFKEMALENISYVFQGGIGYDENIYYPKIGF